MGGKQVDAAFAIPTVPTEHKIALCIAAWYLLSLITLWTNRYVVAELKVDSNLLSLAQLGMSVVCGLVSEVYLVGWAVCKTNMLKCLREGLKDMVILGGVRILTVLLGLTALKYIAVSFTRTSMHFCGQCPLLEIMSNMFSPAACLLSETIKSSAPFFTVVLTYFLLGQRTGWRVNVSLVPIVTGLVFCSMSDSSFHIIGFTAALLSNCVDCIQNVLTKKLLNRSYSVSQLQLYTSIIAVVMQLVFIAYSWATSPPARGSSDTKEGVSSFYIFVLLICDGLGFYFQSVFAYMLMSLVSPVTHSVANCVKRALLITLSIFHFGDQVSLMNWTGMALVIFGVYFFNMASRLERSATESKGPLIAPAPGIPIQKSTIMALSEIRIDKGAKLG
ncbi:Drug/metabolite transporter, partial [Globisporangium splendens]